MHPHAPASLGDRLTATVITLSDRAHAGVYPDRSGPAVLAGLEAFCADCGWRLEARTLLLPDDPERLRAALEEAVARQDMLVLTTGGTGIGPRDHTPDVVARMADRQIPGIMEFIRWKHGLANPNALLSRGVAAVLGQTLVYTLPGSVGGAQEYLAEITRTLGHALQTLRGIDTH